MTMTRKNSNRNSRHKLLSSPESEVVNRLEDEPLTKSRLILENYLIVNELLS
jgi:hypothetical protein